ncbi:hypothetical protein KHA93_06625 [Bacillus sp. FJAT-49732]|uniref:Uncharacterized protein n=1 Tax=Lederbergia citrisecunda TaxID=2833583 RepID=A0A942YMH0_9BACI|nr:hypothetical protein [Lederbergia citrisecunda]MBS4199326.1 hypothetical protein [Lederbergia citrisecunda]
MRKHILKVSKQPYREDSGLTFWVYKPIQMGQPYPGEHGYEYVEHYEKLSFYDEVKVGSQVRYFDKSETDYAVYFEINGEYSPGTLTEIAKEVSTGENIYREQYEAFLLKAKDKVRLIKVSD